MNDDQKLRFFGGVGSTTGANIMLECNQRKILIDCGLFQGTKYAEDKNFKPFKYNPIGINFLLITHAHMDHIGRIPKLVKEGFKGKIISTKETMELAKLMLQDALKVMRSKYPKQELFNENDIERSFAFWEGKKYGEKIKLFDDCFLEMQNAGHILGSAILSVTISKTKITFTGDLGNSPSLLLPDTEFPKEVDYLVMESVYGDRNHENKKDRRKKFKRALEEGIKKGGAIIIPAFSIERTQVLLYELNEMIEGGKIAKVPVFLDSPLAEKVTAIYQKYSSDFKDLIQKEIKQGDNIFNFPGLKIIKNFEESKEIEKTEGTKIIMAGSGMSEGGRIVNHEANYLPDPKATIILVGYQSIGSLGRALQDGVKKVFINTGGNKKKEAVKVRATIENITGYSSHKDSEHLLEFVEKVATSSLTTRSSLFAKEREKKSKLKRVFVIMGEPKSSLFLVQRIKDYLNVDAVYPKEEKSYDLL
ncbi:MAG: MBL fold metallo-hydrolase [Candidatus Zambryskibacteria bacterium]|nr:MBL fold metallo-hydrolase [Candidatus Zambryskibacteria bacterium]